MLKGSKKYNLQPEEQILGQPLVRYSQGKEEEEAHKARQELWSGKLSFWLSQVGEEEQSKRSEEKNTHKPLLSLDYHHAQVNDRK